MFLKTETLSRKFTKNSPRYAIMDSFQGSMVNSFPLKLWQASKADVTSRHERNCLKGILQSFLCFQERILYYVQVVAWHMFPRGNTYVKNAQGLYQTCYQGFLQSSMVNSFSKKFWLASETIISSICKHNVYCFEERLGKHSLLYWSKLLLVSIALITCINAGHIFPSSFN